MQELVESGEQFDEKSFSQKMLLFARVFALCPKTEMFSELTGEAKQALESKSKRSLALSVPLSLRTNNSHRPQTGNLYGNHTQHTPSTKRTRIK
jgi:hypothetical protein